MSAIMSIIMPWRIQAGGVSLTMSCRRLNSIAPCAWYTFGEAPFALGLHPDTPARTLVTSKARAASGVHHRCVRKLENGARGGIEPDTVLGHPKPL
jgi:hypothetical protein